MYFFPNKINSYKLYYKTSKRNNKRLVTIINLIT